MNRLRVGLALMIFLGSLSALGMDGRVKRKRGDYEVEAVNPKIAEAQLVLEMHSKAAQQANLDFHSALQKSEKMLAMGDFKGQAVWRARMQVAMEVHNNETKLELVAQQRLLEVQREGERSDVLNGVTLKKKM